MPEAKLKPLRKQRRVPVFKWLLFMLLFLYGLFWAPWIVIAIQTRGQISSEPDKLPMANTAIVFGGLYDPQAPISEINRERLLAARELLWSHKVDSIVVSNTNAAAYAMREYLLDQQVSGAQIEIDTHADKTPDSCRDELFVHPEKRRVVFVSHAYHLPRILYQCHKLGLDGTGFAADGAGTVPRLAISPIEVFLIRANRLHREAFFTLASLLGYY